LDGTLVDTRKDIVLSAQYMTEQMGGPRLTFEEVCGYVGWGLHDLVGKCLQSTDRREMEKGAEIFRTHYREHMLDHSILYPGARDMLEYFSDRFQAVMTNKPNPFSEQILNALGVAGYFFEIIPGNAAHPKKPDPQALFFMMRKSGCGAGESLFVGDSMIDIEAGRNAGIATVVMSHGFMGEAELKSCGPDFLVRNFDELMGLAKKEGW
jgi:phosphoglycolate phosphatase